jgi:hypothetical protein
MNQKNMQIKQKNRIIIIFTLIVISIMINIYSFARPGPLVDILYRIIMNNDRSIVYLNTGLDNFIEKNVHEGNLFLKFKGYGMLEKESDNDVPLMIYMRICYKMYPREVYVVKPDVVVNKGADIMKNPFNPDKQWLKEHGVKKVLTIIKNPHNNNIGTILDNVE